MPSEGPWREPSTIYIGDAIFENICTGCPTGKQSETELKQLIEKFLQNQVDVCSKAKKKNCTGKTLYGNYALSPDKLRLTWWKSVKAENITRFAIVVTPSISDIEHKLRDEEDRQKTCCGEVRRIKFCPICGKKVGV